MNLGKIGFVLCGGGFAGAYSVGFLKALTGMGIKPDIIQGVSAGVLNGYKYVEGGGNIELLEKKWLEVQQLGPSVFFNWHDIIRRLNKPSLYKNEQLFNRLIKSMDIEAILESAIDFQIVTINESRNRRIIFSNRDEKIKQNPELLATAALASISIPGVLPPVLIDGEWYSDGQTPKLREALKAKCDTIFLLSNRQFAFKESRSQETESGKWSWTQRLAYGYMMSNDSWVVKEIKYLVERGYTLIENCPSPVFDDVRSLPKIVQQKIKKVVDGVAGVVSAENLEDAEHALMPHRIVVLTPPKPIASLYTISFNQPKPKTRYPGDITTAIEQCANAMDDEFRDKIS